MEKLIDLLQRVKPEYTAEELQNSQDLYGDGIIDSLDILTIVEEIGFTFDIEISSADLSRKDFMSVKSLYAMVERYL